MKRWKDYNPADNLLLIMNQTEFRLVHNENMSLLSYSFHIEMNQKSTSLSDLKYFIWQIKFVKWEIKNEKKNEKNEEWKMKNKKNEKWEKE